MNNGQRWWSGGPTHWLIGGGTWQPELMMTTPATWPTCTVRRYYMQLASSTFLASTSPWAWGRSRASSPLAPRLAALPRGWTRLDCSRRAPIGQGFRPLAESRRLDCLPLRYGSYYHAQIIGFYLEATSVTNLVPFISLHKAAVAPISPEKIPLGQTAARKGYKCGVHLINIASSWSDDPCTKLTT